MPNQSKMTQIEINYIFFSRGNFGLTKNNNFFLLWIAKTFFFWFFRKIQIFFFGCFFLGKKKEKLRHSFLAETQKIKPKKNQRTKWHSFFSWSMHEKKKSAYFVRFCWAAGHSKKLEKHSDFFVFSIFFVLKFLFFKSSFSFEIFNVNHDFFLKKEVFSSVKFFLLSKLPQGFFC